MSVLSLLANLVLARLVPPRLLPRDPPLVALAPKERTCSPKRLVRLALDRLLNRLLVRAPCRQGGRCLDRDPPVLA